MEHGGKKTEENRADSGLVWINEESLITTQPMTSVQKVKLKESQVKTHVDHLIVKDFK
jgi:hypothetical protein